MGSSVWRWSAYRSRRGRAPARLTAGAGAFLRPAVPLAVVAVGLFVFGIVITSKTRDVEPPASDGLGAQSSLVAQVGGLNLPPDAKPLEINVVGQRWLWRFDYPQQLNQPPYSTFSYNELVVPVDTPVVLHITSTDVDHRWFIPALGGQVDAIPGRVSDTWFRADREGIYRGQSTAYSGTAYAVMRAWVKVVSPAEYRQFVRQKRREIAAAQHYVQNGGQAGRRDRERQRHEPSHRSGSGPPRGRHRGGPAAPAGLGRARHRHRPQVGGAPLPRRRRCSSLAIAVVEFVLHPSAADRPREHHDPATDLRPRHVHLRRHGGGLFAIPLALGLFSYVVPLQIGSRGVAFPRLNLLSFWLYLVGAATDLRQLSVQAVRGGVRGASAALGEHLPEHPRRRHLGRRAALAVLGFVCFSVNLVVTLHNMRAPGMAWRRVPALHVGGRHHAATCCS